MENRGEINQPTVLENLERSLLLGEPREFINELFVRYAGPKDSDKLIDAVLKIEFVDNKIGYDPATTMSNAFFYGTLIGMHLVDSLHPQPEFRQRVSKKIEQIIDQSFKDTNKTPNGSSARFTFAQKLLDCGREGCNRHPKFASAVEEVEDRFILDVTKSPYMRWGMGLVLFAMDIVDNEQLEIDIANGIDWDAESELLFVEASL